MTIRPPDSGEHPARLHDLFAETFSDYWFWFDYATNGYFDGAPYDWSASRIGIVDGEVATHFGVWDFSMRVGSATVRVAAIGGVATKRPYRNQRMMKATVEDSINGLADRGYDMSLLFGTPGFYPKYGYVSTFKEVRYKVESRDIPPVQPEVSHQIFDGDVRDLAHLYNAENAGVTGTFVRPTYTTNRLPAKFDILRFDDGYVICGREGDTLQVADCAGPPESVLDVCRQRARMDLTPIIEFVFLPARSRTGEYIRTITHKTEARYRRDGGPMIRVVNLHTCLEKIAPALSERLATNRLADYTGTLLVEGNDVGVVLTITDGTVTRVEPATSAAGTGPARVSAEIHAGPSVARLIIGDTSPERICAQHDIGLAGDAPILMPVLFPDQEPSTILWDRF